MNKELKQLLLNNEELLERANLIKKLSNDISENIKNIYELENGKLFYLLIANYSAQKKAPLIEKFLCHKLNLTSVPSSQNQGDAKDGENHYYEFKFSTTNEGGNLNLRQIRPWQDIDYYYCGYIDDKKNIDDSKFYILTKQQMLEEIELNNASFTHGVKDINIINQYSEYSITIPMHSKTSKKLQRWNEKYFSEDLKNKILGGNKNGSR